MGEIEKQINPKQDWWEFIRKAWAIVRRRMFTDSVSIELFGVKIELNRKIPRGVPYEVTVVLPRVEIRKKCDQDSCKDCQWEMILNSITIAHSPWENSKPGQEIKEIKEIKEIPLEIPKGNT